MRFSENAAIGQVDRPNLTRIERQMIAVADGDTEAGGMSVGIGDWPAPEGRSFVERERSHRACSHQHHPLVEYAGQITKRSFGFLPNPGTVEQIQAND